MGVPQTGLVSCPHDEADLHALADGELPAHDGQLMALRARVARCRHCRARWDGIVGTRRLLVAASRDRRDDLPADLAARLAEMVVAS
jgi:anti-sigma factor RsiW